MEVALYHPDTGYYPSGRGAGRRADFLTSPEVGPLFGAVIAHALDTWWDELGRPDPYVVVEAGAGVGTLARTVVDASPRCAAALHYILVERAAGLRLLQHSGLKLEPPRQVLGPAIHASDDEGTRFAPRTGPVLTSIGELPGEPFVGVILANELLDNLPVRILERGPGDWQEILVGESDSGGLYEVSVPASPETAAEAFRLASATRSGYRIPLQHAAAEWLRTALRLLIRGRVVAIDYADTTPSLAARPWNEWLRTYRTHGPGAAPLATVGAQDITCDVAVDQLNAVREITFDRSQAEFLSAHGIGDLVAEARARWDERAAIGDLEAVRSRSRLAEAKALTDPSGLGAFRVLEWVVG